MKYQLNNSTYAPAHTRRAKFVPVVLGIVYFARILLADGMAVSVTSASDSRQAIDDLLAGRFKWTISSPLVWPVNRPGDMTYSVKDPTVVRYKGRWHLFCTIRGLKRSHQIEYLSFKDFKDANAAKRYVLKLSDGYFCAPQVFYFTPHKKWYLIHQVIDKSRKPALQPAYSRTSDITAPDSWSKPTLLFSNQPDNIRMWIDFWVICDATRAYLFFTSLDGRMWRSETKLADFPSGWNRPDVVLRGDIFEASHIYYLKGLDRFLTVIEAQSSGRRYYKAYVAESLDGRWMPLAATKDKPFASPANTRHTSMHWTDSFSHGELIRDGFDQTLAVEPAGLRFLFQGVSDKDKRGKKYGQIPWRLGMLKPL
ncbi:MAG: glycosyl hydrolase family 62 [Desulfobacterales bacterium]|nr:glycosyl hydrolase family 62 [Desulfobacterales bacterium]